MKVSDFDFELPEERIAQEPVSPRDASRLMVLDRSTGATEHRCFSDLPDLLREGDMLVLNDTGVFPARLLGTKETGGKVELLLLEPVREEGRRAEWEGLVSASHPPRPGSCLRFAGGLEGEVLARDGERARVRLTAASGDVRDAIEACGQIPLPPYIHREPGDPRLAVDRERYQTVFAARTGAAAAPTAGLHFTPELLRRLEERGIRRASLTLHVGLGTFLPVRVEDAEDHVMHDEPFILPEGTAAAVEETRRAGGRVVAVGTTVVRVLEDRAAGEGRVVPGSGRSGLFLLPGHRFRVVDALITNFHLPRSTLVMLVAAFAGRERLLGAYREAVRLGYRFYSYGDAMLVSSGR